MDDEFGLGSAEFQEVEVPKAGKARAAKVEKEIDPEEDRENWPIIFIEREKDRPNYEFLQVMGTYRDGRPLEHRLQVMRGVEVSVPPSIVKMLKNAIAAHYEQFTDPVTGTKTMQRTDRSAIPWRLVRGGKYIQ